jgi:2-isopropylmalate synthase
VLYIPIDPADVGRSYKAIIRINSQSGKGGVAYVLEHEFGFQLPKLMHKEIGKIINHVADAEGTELTPQKIHEIFRREYLEQIDPVLTLQSFEPGPPTTTVGPNNKRQTFYTCSAEIDFNGQPIKISGIGNGPIDAFVSGLHKARDKNNKLIASSLQVLGYYEHSLGRGADARAISYIQVRVSDRTLFGAGIDTNIELASIKAIVSALNRAGNK